MPTLRGAPVCAQPPPRPSSGRQTPLARLPPLPCPQLALPKLRAGGSVYGCPYGAKYVDDDPFFGPKGLDDTKHVSTSACFPKSPKAVRGLGGAGRRARRAAASEGGAAARAGCRRQQAVRAGAAAPAPTPPACGGPSLLRAGSDLHHVCPGHHQLLLPGAWGLPGCASAGGGSTAGATNQAAHSALPPSTHSPPPPAEQERRARRPQPPRRHLLRRRHVQGLRPRLASAAERSARTPVSVACVAALAAASPCPAHRFEPLPALLPTWRSSLPSLIPDTACCNTQAPPRLPPPRSIASLCMPPTGTQIQHLSQPHPRS